ncbi:MAG TPA: dihydrofolate reductase family protein [Gammaproteobacteria bacterium]|jgi:riboflavin-specific deaminase-like protein|nr:dihydrofolate reductase family protein [Gammaproteobacteria bacterium]
MPFPHSGEAATGDLKALQRLVFSALKSAAAWSRGAAKPAGPRAFGIDSAGRLTPAARDARPWLLWHPDTGWTAGDGAPPDARVLLDLYLPVCRPATIGHLGQSLDGCIATGSGDSYYVTGPDNVLHLHRLRALCDAVVVGAGTVARDDPRLTVRHVDGANPVRVILDPRRRLPAARRVFAADDAPTLLVCAAEHAPRAGERHGVAEVVAVPADNGRLRLDALLSRLHERGLRTVFVEGGGTTVSRFLEAGLLDRLHVAIAPLVTGSGRPGLSLPARDKIADCLRPQHRVFAMGGDVLFDCDLRAPAAAGGESPTGEVARVL